MNENLKTLGKQIGVGLKRLGVSEEELAAYLGSRPETVRRWIREGFPGRKSLEILVALTTAFGCSSDWLLKGKGPDDGLKNYEALLTLYRGERWEELARLENMIGFYKGERVEEIDRGELIVVPELRAEEVKKILETARKHVQKQ